MITVIISDFKEITANNYKAHTACLAIHELMCSCGHKGCFVRHAYYRRLLKTKKGTITLNILRVKCKGCGRTHAILPELVVPYSQVPADLQQYILLYSLGSAVLDGLMQDNTDITESNILSIRSRYKQHWKERLRAIGCKLQNKIADIIRKAFLNFHRQFMQIHKGVNLAFMQIHIT